METRGRRSGDDKTLGSNRPAEHTGRKGVFTVRIVTLCLGDEIVVVVLYINSACVYKEAFSSFMEGNKWSCSDWVRNSPSR